MPKTQCLINLFCLLTLSAAAMAPSFSYGMTPSYCLDNVLTEDKLVTMKNDLDKISQEIKSRIDSKNLKSRDHFDAVEIMLEVTYKGVEIQNLRNILYLHSLKRKANTDPIASLLIKLSVDNILTAIEAAEKVIRIRIPMLDDYGLSNASREYRDSLESFNKSAILCK